MSVSQVIFIIIIGLCLTTLAESGEVQLTERVNLGDGVDIIGINGSAYQSFLGISFAKPPLRELRFANPVPKALAPGTLHAYTEKSQCIQLNFLLPNQDVMGAEDCLYLNIYRPQMRSYTECSKLPVMVFIHGGAFFSGSMNPGIIGPGYFMKQKVILVTLQYRLSTLGFLSTNDSASPGNFGLKDQSVALKWVKENIIKFGGDPELITIFGQSAGAASVHMHMLSPLSRGLFAQAITMSGNAIGGYNYPTKDPLALARRHAKIVGIDPADNLTTSELVERLRNIPADQLISSVSQLKFFDVDSLTVYRTVVEQSAEGAFLTKTPLELLRRGEIANVPYMTGSVQAEGAVRAAAIIVNANVTEKLNEDIPGLIPQLMELQLKGQQRKDFTQKIIERYLPGSGKLTPENDDSFVKLYSDRSFKYPHYMQLQIMLGREDFDKPIYTYYFDYRGANSYSLFFTGTTRDFGVVHCDDLIYLFESPLLFPNGLNEKDTEMSNKLVQQYFTFAQGKEPWTKTTLEGEKLGPYMSLADMTTGYYDDWELIRFWNQTEEFV